jgi:ParB-like chromosome segregation protein Spo0J
LALKTNLIREGMTEREQGKVLFEIKSNFNLSDAELGRRIGKDHKWIGRRILLAMNLNKDVQQALEDKKINNSVAEVIGTLEPGSQTQFLEYLLKNNITSREDAYKLKKYYLNTTIYTIGYEGKELKDFIKILKDNGIEYLLDVRFSVFTVADSRPLPARYS